VNHPALVNPSDQPSFSSVYFSPLTSAEALRASDMSPVPNLNLQQPTRGGTAKKISISSYRKFLGQLRKRISNRPLNPKPIGLRRTLFLAFQKDRREGLPRSNSVWHFISFEHKPSCSFRWWFDGRRGARCWWCVLYWSFLWRPQWRRVDRRNISDGRTICVLVWSKILFVRLFRDKHCFVLSMCPLYL